jgi:amidase
MRRELRERLGDALGIPKKHWDTLDCIESQDLFAIFKPGGAASRDSVSEPQLRPLLRQALVAACAAIETFVLDAALFDDALRGPAGGDLHTPPEPDFSFAQAAVREPRSLRVAVSLRCMIHGIRPGHAAREAVDQTAELLRSLGHQVAEQNPRYGQLANGIAVRSLAGIADDAAKLDQPDLLGSRARQMAALGRRAHGRMLQRARRRELPIARRVNAIFADHDLLLTPVTAVQPALVEKWHDAGTIRTLLGGGAYVTYTAPWNYLGQPAASIPAGLDETGLPTAIQLAGPPGSETTIISLAAQLERARPWAHLTPPLAR